MRFERAELEQAIEIQERAWRLLRWVNEALRRGFLTPSGAHHYASDVEAASGWVREHVANIPSQARPPSLDREPLDRFARFFVTFLDVSFEPSASAGEHWAPHCDCWGCGTLYRAPHLKARKAMTKDKRRAEKMRLTYLRQLALDLGLAVQENAIERLSATSARDVTLCTYAASLVGRCLGRPATPAVLVLWRKLARKAPKRDPGFELRAEEVLAAEDRLAAELAGTDRNASDG